MQTITEKRRIELKEIQRQLNLLNDSIQSVIDGKSSMVQLSKALNIPSQTLGYAVKNEGLYMLARRMKILNKDDIEQLLKDSASPAERLIRVILGCNHELIIVNITEEDKLLEIMQEALTEREYDIIDRRFGFTHDTMTLFDTANHYNITATRVRQIEAKAIRKLRNPMYLVKLLPDYDLKIKKLEEADRMVELTERCDRQIKSSTDIYEYYKSISIDEMGLCVRSYNCLKRKGVDTVGDLAKLSIAELSTFRNLGKISLKEITDILKDKYNIILEDEKIILN